MPLSGHGSRAAPEGSAWVSASQSSKRGVIVILVVATGVLVVATGSVGVLVAVTVAVMAGRPPLACVQLTYIHTPSCDFYFMCSLAVCEVQLSHM